jgi:hypothetical protein
MERLSLPGADGLLVAGKTNLPASRESAHRPDEPEAE